MFLIGYLSELMYVSCLIIHIYSSCTWPIQCPSFSNSDETRFIIVRVWTHATEHIFLKINLDLNLTGLNHLFTKWLQPSPNFDFNFALGSWNTVIIIICTLSCQGFWTQNGYLIVFALFFFLCVRARVCLFPVCY